MGNDGGWHITGIVGVIATTAACCKLMKLPVEQVANAIGIGVSLSSGIAVNYGTMTKPLHCGNAARNGVMAAMLASKGFTSHAAAFEGNNGFYASFGRALPTDFAPFERSRQALGPDRDRLPDQVLSLRRARPHRDRSGADVARQDRLAARRDQQHPLPGVAVEREAHQHQLSATTSRRRNSPPPT